MNNMMIDNRSNKQEHIRKVDVLGNQLQQQKEKVIHTNTKIIYKLNQKKDIFVCDRKDNVSLIQRIRNEQNVFWWN